MIKDYIVKDIEKACDNIFTRYVMNTSHVISNEPSEFQGCLFIYTTDTMKHYDTKYWTDLESTLTIISNCRAN
jgi:hypothetical protein